MLERLSDRWKAEAGGALTRAAIAFAAAVCIAIAVAFLCAAVFVVVLRDYGVTDACLAGAAFFVVAAFVLLAAFAGVAASRRRAIRALHERAEAETASSPLADPRLVLVALQVIQAVGFRRMLPIFFLGGAAFALASRPRPARRGARGMNSHAPPGTI